VSIYQAPGFSPYTLVKGGGTSVQGGGDVLNDQLLFGASCVIVDNPSSVGTVFLPDVGRSIPPQTYGAVVPLPNVTTARAQWQGAAAADTAVLTFLEDPQPASPGVTRQINVINTPSVTIAANQSIAITGTPTVAIAANQSVAISGTVTVSISSGTVTISGTPNINIASQSVQVGVNLPATRQADITFTGAQTLTTNYVLPTGTHAVSILFLDSFANYSSVQLIGHDTGFVYYGQVPSTDGTQWYVFPIVSSMEASWDVKITRTAAGGSTVRVAAVQDTEILFAITPAAGAMPIVNQPQLVPQEALFGSMNAASYRVLLGANATLSLVPGAAGKKIYCFATAGLVSSAASAVVSLEDDTTSKSIALLATHLAGFYSHPLAGFFTSAGNGLRLRNQDAVAAGGLNGEVIYSQK
jgi:hypothetical protein